MNRLIAEFAIIDNGDPKAMDLVIVNMDQCNDLPTLS